VGLLKKIGKFAKSKVGKAIGKAVLVAVSKGKAGKGAQGGFEAVMRAKQSIKGAGLSTILPKGAPPKPMPVSVQVNVAKATPIALPQLGGRQAMPGGAAMKGAVVKRRKAAARPRAAKKAARKAAATNTGRKVGAKRGGAIGGKGSLDLKATSVKWKKAGSPGRWIDYVKSSGVRRG